jgi:predicted PolB exonuclease-like 3'-5' exonuclease/SAM-dependent methyltransferase
MPAHLVLDIETIPDPELPRQDDSERVPAPPFNQIVTLGCMLLEDWVPRRLGVVGEHQTEGAMLSAFAEWLEAKRPTVVTWNGRGFDMPVITSRALRHGVPMPWWFSDRNTRYRYSTEGHFDLMDFLADFGAAKNARLDVYARLVGFPGKVGVDGSQVLPLVHAGKIDEVNAYCLCDVAQTAAIFLRVELLRGSFDRAHYGELARAMLAFIDEHPRLEAIAGKIDRARFLLDTQDAPSDEGARPTPIAIGSKRLNNLESWRGTVQFGKTASDYARHRAGFPDAFFDRLAAMAVVRPGMRALDLGTGTGSVARGLATRGCVVTGLDKSSEMMAQAAVIDGEAGVSIRYVEAAAEATGLDTGSFDIVTAGQCWHWFDRARAAEEARRVLVSGGRLVIAHFDWVPLPGNVARVTEELIERFNPEWKFGNQLGLYPVWLRDMGIAGFGDIETVSFDVNVMYSHEAWRGRVRASAGVGATLSPEKVQAFDEELRRVLMDGFPVDPVPVLHRVWAAIGGRP